MSIFGNLKDKVANYVDVRLSLLKLNFIERATLIVSYLIFTFVALFVGVTFLIFLGIGLGEWLANVFDSRPAGYFATSGLFALFLLAMILARKKIIDGVAGVFIRVMTEADERDADKEQQNNNNIEVE